MMEHRIYLDHSATTPLRSEVLGAMTPYFSDLAEAVICGLGPEGYEAGLKFLIRRGQKS